MTRRGKKKLLPFIKWTGLTLIFAVLAFSFYCLKVSREIEKRFSGRRWSIPSKVYSDSTLLFPGQRINSTLFFGMFEDLGYRFVSHRPAHKGEMRKKGRRVEIFLRDLKLPSRQRPGYPVTVVLNEGEIEGIHDSRNGEEIPILELEPEELMLFFGPEREQRRLISIDQVPENVQRAFLAAEDLRFFDHHGLDPKGILRALYVNLKRGDIHQGGSTITQQLAKNYFLTPERSFSRKCREIVMALVIDLMYDKKEILEIYLNEIYFGQKGSVAVNGLGEASYFYFGKPVSELTLEEGAAIAGLIRAPNHYSPYVDKARCRERRNAVLQSMARQGWISREDYNRVAQTPVQPSGYQAYGKKAPYFVDYLCGQLETLYPPEVLSSLGLSVFTTLDTQVQKAAEAALSNGLARLEKHNPALAHKDPEKRLQGAMVVMQPKTGYLLAMVGGRDYGASQFNRATQAMRQPGSAFKPFVYLCGLESFTPASLLSNEPVSYEVDGEEWTPRNIAPEHETQVSLRSALARSLNLATVDLAMKTGLDAVIQTASAFGFSTPLKPYPSLALGASEVVPMELARAYCAFAADGLLPFPLSMKDVINEKGEVLQRRHMDQEQATTPSKAYIMSSLLHSVVEEGTARSLKTLGIFGPVAGKTGTTNDFRDAWFVGYTPDILALVWVGFDDGGPVQGTGSAVAMPIWAELMKNIPQHLSGDWFRRPPGVVEEIICPESGLIAAPGCPNPKRELFLEDQVPSGVCPLHGRPNIFRKLFEEIKDYVENP